MRNFRSRPAFLLLDALVGTAVFSILLGAVGFSLFASQRSAMISGEYQRATGLTESALEAVRSMRDEDFALLTEGQHGLRIGSSGHWEFSGTGTLTSDGYTTTVTITPQNESHLTVVASTTWQQITGTPGSVTLATDITDWRQEYEIGNWETMDDDPEGSYIDTGTPLFTAITVGGAYAYLTSQADAGLFIFDITDTASPARVASTFTLGDSGYDVLSNGSRLYVVTSNSTAELQIYDTTDPLNLSFLGSIDLPGDGRARTAALFGHTVFIGATHDLTHHEFYAYDTEDPQNIALLDSLDNEGGGFNGISLHEGYAYLSGTSDLSELAVVDIFDPSDLVSVGGFPLTDIYDGTAVATFGSSVLFGRTSGTAIEEAIIFDIGDGPIPQTDPPPLYGEAGGTVYAVAADTTGTYAFITTDTQTDHGASGIFYQALLVMKLDDFPVVSARYETDTTDGIGYGRAVYYDVLRDRVLLATDKGFFIFAPGS